MLVFVDWSFIVDASFWELCTQSQFVVCSFFYLFLVFVYAPVIYIYIFVMQIHVQIEILCKKQKLARRFNDRRLYCRGMHDVRFMLSGCCRMRKIRETWNQEEIGHPLCIGIVVRFNREELDKAHQWIIFNPDSIRAYIGWAK